MLLSDLPAEILDLISYFLVDLQDFKNFRLLTSKSQKLNEIQHHCIITGSDRLFRLAVEKNHLGSVIKMITFAPYIIDIRKNDNEFLYRTCELGHYQILQVLLEKVGTSRSDLAIPLLLYTMAKSGARNKSETLKTLLNYHETGQILKDNSFICYHRGAFMSIFNCAIRENEPELAILLLETFPSMDTSSDDYYAYMGAIKQGSSQLLSYLLGRNPHQDLSPITASLISNTCRMGKLELLQILLQDQRFQNVASHGALQACLYGHDQILEKIVEHINFQLPPDLYRRCLYWSNRTGNQATLKILLSGKLIKGNIA